MALIPSLLLAAAVLPYLAAISAKAGGRQFDNDSPRAWLATQQGWRMRANAAQTNLFEGLPFFFAAVLYALHTGAETVYLAGLMATWVLLRILFVIAYILGRGTVRSIIWSACLAINIMILFAN